MTDLELSGRVLPALPGGDADRVAQLTAAWLARRTKNTQREYRADLTHWWAVVRPARRRPPRRPDDAHGRLDRLPARPRRPRRRPARRRGQHRPPRRRRLLLVQVPLPQHQRRPAAARVHQPRRHRRPAVIDPDNSGTVGLSTAEADRLCLAADADGPRSSALIRLLLYGGLRCGSALTAGIGDLGHDRGYRTLTVHGKGGKTRRVPIPAALGEAIDAYLAVRGNPKAGLLFVTRTGKRLSEPYLYDLVRRLARNAGIPAAPDLSPHSLRHTFATDYLDAGGNLRDLQDAMGHADPQDHPPVRPVPPQPRPAPRPRPRHPLRRTPRHLGRLHVVEQAALAVWHRRRLGHLQRPGALGRVTGAPAGEAAVIGGQVDADPGAADMDATRAVVPVPPNGSTTTAGRTGAVASGQAHAYPVMVVSRSCPRLVLPVPWRPVP